MLVALTMPGGSFAIMAIQIKLSVKFRAFGITFANYSHSWTFPALVAPFPIHFSDRGVTLEVTTVPLITP